MEEFDLVDIHDTVIGVTTKDESHITAGIHRLVAVFVFNNKGELFMQYHERSGLWDHSVGGHVGKGETYDAAVEREAFEELGLNGPFIKLAHFFSDETSRGKPIKHFFTLYECTPKNWEFVPNAEVKRVQPLSIDAIVTRMKNNPSEFTPGFINTMTEYLKIRK